MGILNILGGLPYQGTAKTRPTETIAGIQAVSPLEATPTQRHGSLIALGRQRADMVSKNPLGVIGQASEGSLQPQTSPKNWKKLLFDEEG